MNVLTQEECQEKILEILSESTNREATSLEIKRNIGTVGMSTFYDGLQELLESNLIKSDRKDFGIKTGKSVSTQSKDISVEKNVWSTTLADNKIRLA